MILRAQTDGARGWRGAGRWRGSGRLKDIDGLRGWVGWDRIVHKGMPAWPRTGAPVR
ncbi:Hypothetical protein CAP_8503 [Chondromyces apiculatus DSM 436]|uniref:Uncharacterized protein n=1 Tax=Chondromyces apiculatus DSM 436 TaxID=1192034 RepID=A0A017SXA0_9BACT|nr:Hypothetical protein CAP_8503 [Chondromyces apiculatus DSM 436]